MRADAAARSTPARRMDLDLLRGVAILLALGWHFNQRDTGLALVDALLLPGRTIGWAGVDLFFVISGFLVGGLVFGEYQRTGTFRGRRFLLRRAFKIWPVLYLYVALLVATGRYEWTQVVPQTLFHVQNYFLTPVSHLWSLAVEEQFYLLFALAFTLWVRHGGARLTTLPSVLVALIVLSPALRVLAVAAGWDAVAVQSQTQFRMDALACGVLLAYLKCFHPARFDALLAHRLPWLAVAIVGAAFLVGTRGDLAIRSTVGYTVAYLVSAAGLLLVYGRPWALGGGPLVRALAWLGTYSYALYVFQFVAFRAGEALWHRIVDVPMPVLAEVALRYLGAVAVAVTVTKALERPLLTLRDRRYPSG